MTILTDFFNSDALQDEVMYYVEMHGFLTSLAIQPKKLSQEDLIQEVFASADTEPNIIDNIYALQDDINQALLKGEFPDTPSIDEDEDSLILWCTGFMQGIFIQEQAWFSEFPDDIAELTLPILSCTELLDDELDGIQYDEELIDTMAEKIPDCVIDLYLLLNSPDS